MKKTILALTIATLSSSVFAQGGFVVFIDKTPTVQYVIENDDQVVEPEIPVGNCEEWMVFANANKDLINRDWDQSIEGYPDITSCDQAVSTNINHDVEASKLSGMPTSKMPFTNFSSFVMASDLIPASVIKDLDINTFGISVHKNHLTDYGNIDVMFFTIYTNNDTNNHVFNLPNRYNVENAAVSLSFKNTTPITVDFGGNVKSFSVTNDFSGEMNIVKMPNIKDELMLYGNVNVLDSQASSKINGARSLSFAGKIDDLTFLSGVSLRSNSEGSASVSINVSATSLDGLEEVLGNTTFAEQWKVTLDGENSNSNFTDISALASIGKQRFSDKKMNFGVSTNPLVDSPKDPNSPFCQWVVGDYDPISSDSWLHGTDGRTVVLGSRANLEYAYQNCRGAL